jgi:hypothetical protein
MGINENNWKAYQYYCLLCTNNQMSPLSFEKWLYIIRLLKKEVI